MRVATMFAFMLLLLIIVGLAGRADIEDAKRQQEAYCDNVAIGAWPDYQHNFEELCQP